MARTSLYMLAGLALLGCQRDGDPVGHAEPGRAAEAGVLTWYRAVLRAADGVEAPFLLGVPAPGARGEACFRVGNHDVRSPARFDGQVLEIRIAVNQTSMDAALDSDGVLRGTFAAAGPLWYASTLPLTATLAAPMVRALATTELAGAALDLREPRTVWQLAMRDSGVAKLVLEQLRPGELTGVLSFATGNLIYLAGPGRGDTVVLSGFDGASAYRLELALDATHVRARGAFFGGSRLDWRETLTATRGEEFALAIEAKPTRTGVRVQLPKEAALAALEPGPLVVEISASWCTACRSAAPFLAELARTYRPRGLRMVTLLYDLDDDRAADAKQAALFKQAYGATWPVVPISGGLDVLPEILPSGLVGVNPAGFPITLFLAADRTLVGFHVGFPAAATEESDEHRRVTAEFRATIETMLAPRSAK